MRTSKKIVSLVLAVLMVASMMVVGTVVASAAGSYTVNGTAYTSLSTAMQKGETVVMTADSTENYVYCNMSTKKNVTIDLGGHTLTFPSPASGRTAYFVTNTYGVEITIINGTIDFAESAALSDTACVSVEKDANFIVGEGATLKSHGDNATIFAASNSTVTVDGGSVQAEDSFAIVANGSSNSKGSHNYKIEVKDGSVSSDITAIYHCNDGDLKISGGEITGRPAVYVKSGTTTITGGTLNGVGADTDYSFNGNGANSTGDALVVDSCGYPGGAPSVTVTGGTFNSENGEAVASYVKQDDPAYPTATCPKTEDFVAGGTLNGAQPVDTDIISPAGDYDANTGIVTLTKPFSVGDQAFDDFSDALAYVQAGGTIKVVADTMLNNAADVAHDVIDKNVTIDLCCNTLTTAPRNGATAASKENTRYDFLVKDGAEVTLKNGTVESYNTYFGFFIEDGTVTIASDAVYNGYNETTVLFIKPTGTVNVYGTVVTEDYFTIGVNGGESHDYTINIYAPAVVTSAGSEPDVGIYHCGNGTLNISGGTITGTTAVLAKAGETKITGGTLVGTGAKKEYDHNNNGSSDTGDALMVENCSYPAGSPKVNITGGTFTSVNGNAVGSYAEDEDYPVVNNFIGGGIFSTDVNDYAKNGVYFKANALGKYTTSNSSNPNKLEYKKYNIEGYQDKIEKTPDESTGEGNDINAAGLRIVTKFTNNINASDYGYVIAKFDKEDDRTVDQLSFDVLKKDGQNGEKTISCVGTENNIPGYGANYVTLAVNGMEEGDKVVARFYAVIGGETYYSDYISAFGNINGGVLAEM